MKKLILLLLFVLVFGASFFLLKNKVQQNKINQSIYKDFSVIDYKLEGESYSLLLADTPEKWEKGLMYFRSLEGVDGMIFIFPDKQIRNFWNKNTFMDLELLWIDSDKIIGRSELPSIEKSKEIITVESPAPADKVIELPF